MTFSIVIPTYNGEKYIEEAIKSVLEQTRQPDEIVISDDNSTDKTLEICNRYADKIKIFKNESGPSGFVNGWNNAIAYASCDFVSILHQDDKLAPTFLAEIEIAVNTNPDVKHFFTPCSIIDETGNVIRTYLDYCTGETHRFSGQEYANAYERVKGHIHRCPGVVTHKDIFKKCKYRTEAGHIADDDFFIRVGNHTDVIGILKPLAYYREHSQSETGHLSFFKLNKRLLDDYHFQLSNVKDNPLLSDEIIETFRLRESEYVHRLFIFGLKRGEWKYSFNALKQWISFKKGYGNMRYDLSKIPVCLKDKIRKSHISYLSKKASRLKILSTEELKKNLIIAPHPDNEVIGCGGLIARLVEEDDAPQIIVMTGGEGSHENCCSTPKEEIIRARRGLTRKALSILGVPESNIHELNFPDGNISESHSEVEKLKTLIGELKPDTVFMPHWGEGWPDHVKTAEIVKKLLPNETEVWEYCVWMWYYNVWRGLDWRNAAVLKMTPPEHELKLKAIDAYTKPLAPCGRPWSGVLPPLFLKANSGERELYFKSEVESEESF